MIMDLRVTKKGEGSLVTPKGPTPRGTVLDLSVIDRLPVLRCNARTLHVFKRSGEEGTVAAAGDVIREAFSKALVPYYPLAGRLKISPHDGQLQIECSGEGIWFEEASADCTLDDVNYLDESADSQLTTFDKLLPHPIAQEDTFMDPLVLVQVNFCHSICDGLGAAQFLKAVGEFARGVEKPSVAPVWCREYLLPSPHETKSGNSVFIPPPLPDQQHQLQHASFDISTVQINQLKHKVMQNDIAVCSSFEIIAAMLWRQRTRAITNNNNDSTSTHEVKLVFFANCRQLVKKPSPLPDGFYGNCFFPVTVTASKETVAQGSLAEVVKLIQDAKTKLPEKFSKWLIKKTGGDDDEDPFAPGRGVGYETLFISEWGRLGFNEVDYGWGKPVHVIPVQGSPVIPVGIVSKQPLPGNGVRLMTWCVHNHHLPSFVNMMAEEMII